jgi:hypothetical protein
MGHRGDIDLRVKPEGLEKMVAVGDAGILVPEHVAPAAVVDSAEIEDGSGDYGAYPTNII